MVLLMVVFCFGVDANAACWSMMFDSFLGKGNWPFGKHGSCIASAASQAVAAASRAFDFPRVCAAPSCMMHVIGTTCTHARRLVGSKGDDSEREGENESGQQMWLVILAEYALGEAAREAALVELRKSTKGTQFIPIPMLKIADTIRRAEDIRVCCVSTHTHTRSLSLSKHTGK
jgi:hypothetical protein